MAILCPRIASVEYIRRLERPTIPSYNALLFPPRSRHPFSRRRRCERPQRARDSVSSTSLSTPSIPDLAFSISANDPTGANGVSDPGVSNDDEG